MRCRIEHIGPEGSPNLSISDFTLAPGFTSEDFELKENSPDMNVVNEWVQEGLVRILPPGSTGKTKAFSGAGGRSKGQTMTAKEVKEYMKPRNKRRRRTALSRIERNMATHKPPVGSPFGHGKKVRIFTAEELAKGKPEPLPPEPVPDENKREIDRGTKKIYTAEEIANMNSEGESVSVGGANRSGAKTAPIKLPDDDKILSPADIKKMNKANIKEPEIPEDGSPEIDKASPTTDENESAEEVTGEQPIDTLILDVFVEGLEKMTKTAIRDIAEKAEIELPNQINKTPLIARVAEALAEKGYTELPE